MADEGSRAREAAAALAAAPSDLGTWLALVEALAEAGEEEEAAVAAAALGEAASELGQVALAVGCARWLSDRGDPPQADELVARIAEVHCRGSSRIERGLRPRPPGPPGVAAPAEPAGSESATLIDRARAAVDLAARSARERAQATLAPTPLVSVLEADDFRELVAVMRLVRFAAGETVIDVGEPALALFWVARGRAVASRDGHELGELRANAFFGEIALVGGTSRTARVAAVEPSWLLEIPAASVEAIAARAPKLAKVLANYARARLLANVMRTSELFRRLSDDERRELLPLFETRLFGAGERVVEKGEAGDRLYVVVAGRCEVRDEGQLVATLAVGDGVGEISLIARKPAVADVVAVENSVMLTLDRERFDSIADKHPGLLAEVYKLLVERERENRDTIVHDATDLIL